MEIAASGRIGYTEGMALSPSEQALEALRSALDQVPLTAEQRQKTLSEFALRIGQPVIMPASPALPSLPPMVLSPTAQAGMQASPMATVGAPSDPKIALQAALSHALEAAHTSAAPIPVESRTIVQEELISRLKNRMDEQSDGIDHSVVKALVRDSLVRERRRAGGMSVGHGIMFAIIESIVLATSLVGIVLGVGGLKLFAEPLFLTVADIFIVVIGLQVLGSLHEYIWLSTPKFYNLATLIRGAFAPLSIPLGLLLFVHEWVWRDYSQNKLGRIIRALISPLSVPIGLVWNVTGWIIQHLNAMAAPKKPVSKDDSALKEKEKTESKPNTLLPVAAAA